MSNQGYLFGDATKRREMFRADNPDSVDLPDETVDDLIAVANDRARQAHNEEVRQRDLEELRISNARVLSGRPRKYSEAVADDPRILEWVKGYSANYIPIRGARVFERPHYNSLFLYGPPGTGKTWQALGIPAAAAECEVPADHLYVRAVDYLDGQQNSGFEKKEDLYNRALGARLLILDDLFAGGEHKRSASDIYRLLDARFMDERPTVIISNLAGKELSAALGERLADRLREDAVSVKFDGESRRSFRWIRRN